VRLLADESCDFAVVRALRSAGHDVKAVGESLPGAADETVLSLAAGEKRVLITEDKRPYAYDELLQRDKVSLDIFWLKDESLESSEHLPDPDVIAAEISEDLRAALEQFETIQGELTEE
jgi:hypothetical protein